MTAPPRHKVFNRKDRVVEGWYWALRSSELPRGRVKALTLMGKELVVFRGEDGRVAALDARCPHLGAHLALGKVEGSGLRCALHQWKLDAEGRCVNVPCQAKPPPVQNRSWPVEEKYDLVWIYTGRIPRHPVPSVPELEGKAVQTSLGRRFTRKCHPNVALLPAIDVQRFYAVHNHSRLFDFETKKVHDHCITFRHVGEPVPWLLGKPLTYCLSYWNGTTGTFTVGPAFLQLHLMLALRLGPDGVSEGQPVFLTKKRPGILGRLVHPFLLLLTWLLWTLIARRQSPVFQSLELELKTPVRADRALIDFAQHVDGQRLVRWGYGELPEATSDSPQLPAALAAAFRLTKMNLRN